MKLELDDWQKEVLATKGNMCVCSGRQSGKSTVISMDAGEFAVKNKNKTIMIIASVERQALLLFEKVLSYIYTNYKPLIAKKAKKPTKHKLTLTNGSVIHCLPTGESGYGIRGYTIDRLYADEAAFIPEDVWAAVTPMLATTGGDIVLLSTPFGIDNYFHRCFNDPKFHTIHVNTELVAESRKDPQRTMMIEFLRDEKERMTKLQYQQEYLGLFVGGIMKFFPDEAISKSCILGKGSRLLKSVYNNFLGVDIARHGSDETVLVSVERIKKDKIRMFGLEITEDQKLTDTTRLILHKDKENNYKRIYLDATGMGWGVFDPLKEHNQTKRKVIAVEALKKDLHKEKGKEFNMKKITQKEDRYNNLRNLMENGKAQLFNTPEVRQSLRSIQYEYTDTGKMKIYGNYDHIADALAYAAWCVKDKSLNIYYYT
jgi:hypothetical protein